MKKISHVILIVLPLQIFGQSVGEVVNAALDYNSQVKAANVQTQSAEMEKISEQRSHLPSISLKASYVHNTDVPQFNVPIPGFNQTVTLNPHDIYETGIHLDYVLFSGFAQSQAAKVKAFEHTIAAVNEDQEKKNIAFKTVQAYRNGQLMKLSLGILDDTRRRNFVQMNKARALLENGMALRLDTLSLSLNRTMIEQQIIESHSVLENWFQILEMLTGQKVSLAETPEINAKPQFNSYTAEEQNSLKNMYFKQQQMSALSSIEKAAYYPKVWLNASFNYGKPGPDIVANEWDTYGKWMIGLQWEIWNGWSTATSVQAKDLNLQALQFLEKAMQEKLKLDYDKAVRSFRALQKQLVVAEKAVNVAREKMKIVEISTEKGQLTTSDFNEANLELSQAELREKQILIQLNLQATEIDYLSGKPVNMWRL